VRPAHRFLCAGLACVAWAALGACAATPQYVAPKVETPSAFKESADWKAAEPADALIRGAWWEIFQDQGLDALEARLSVSNQTLKAAEAQYEQARALVRSAEAARVPQVGASGSVTRNDVSNNKPLRSSTSPTQYADYVMRADVSYEADVWGRVRQSILASRATAQASAADLESVGLSLHAELALDYFELQAIDAERQLIDSSVTAYQRALDLTRNRHAGGLASGVDVAQAETQLYVVQAQSIDLGVRRAQLEHALATLVGQPASGFTLPRSPLATAPPRIPAGVPSAVLERRPDLAAAERRLMAAHAQVGVARSALFPVFTLTGSTGFQSSRLEDWLKGASNFWLAAPAVAANVFDGGRRRAAVQQAEAARERAEAQYRDIVLVALREVEDSLAALRILADEAAVQKVATEAAQRSMTLSLSRYRGGVTSYLEVVTSQNTALQAQRTSLAILRRQMAASVQLVKALGGGWDRTALPAF
jgi:NodT family efflux transporter outer membrane factor (OMF) lipoprotein